jgi:hypothetical protein
VSYSSRQKAGSKYNPCNHKASSFEEDHHIWLALSIDCQHGFPASSTVPLWSFINSPQKPLSTYDTSRPPSAV